METIPLSNTNKDRGPKRNLFALSAGDDQFLVNFYRKDGFFCAAVEETTEKGKLVLHEVIKAKNLELLMLVLKSTINIDFRMYIDLEDFKIVEVV